jgi:predicted transcriptional regulator
MQQEMPFIPNIEVLLRIVQVFDSHQSVRKTRLHLASRIRWNSFVKYLDWLTRNGYLQCESDVSGDTYFLTDTGRARFMKLSEFLQDGTPAKIATLVRRSVEP